MGRPNQIILIRHAERPSKPDNPNPWGQGVSELGTPDPHSLSVRGWQRAGALVRYFAANGIDDEGNKSANDFFYTPTSLYASKADISREHEHSFRMQETITPLAAELGFPMNTTFFKDEWQQMVDQILDEKTGIVLICWDHLHHTSIAQRIMAPDIGGIPEAWDHDRFDITWVFTLNNKTGFYNFRQLPQLILPGDSREVL